MPASSPGIAAIRHDALYWQRGPGLDGLHEASGAPSSAQVYSQNIAGYTTVTLDKQYTIVGLNFEDCAGGPILLQDAVPYATGMTKGADDTTADCIQIQKTSGYDTYYLSNGAVGKGTNPALEGKWVKLGETPVQASTNTLGVGTAFWYLARNPSSTFKVAMAGQVLVSSTTNITVNLSAKHIANPFPVDLPLNNGIPYTVGMTKGADDTTADCIQIQKASGYDTYYLSNGAVGKGTDPALEEKWVKLGETPAKATLDSIPVGKGAWYMRRGAADFTVEVVRPFSL